MYRYTTPTIPCKLTGVDFSRVDYVRIAVEGKDRVCDKLKEVLVREIPASGFDEAFCTSHPGYKNSYAEAAIRHIKKVFDKLKEEHAFAE